MPIASRRLLLALLPLALGVLVACSEARPPVGPNVLWICVDVLRADRLGAYGYPRPTSPRLDQLAQDGARFERAYAQTSWTKPSVPSYLTSSYPVEHRVLEGSTKDQAGRIVSDVLGEEWSTAAELFRDAGWHTGAFVTNAQLRSFLGFDQGFDVYAEELGSAREINAELLEWIDDIDEPFFAYLHYIDVHWPYRPEPEHLAHFPAPPTELDLVGPGAPSLLDRINAGRVAVDDDDRAALSAAYDGTVRQVDEAIAAVLEELARRGLADDTIVVVSSDHGEELFEHGTAGHGRSLRDTLVHVPLVLAGPGIAPGRVVRTPVESIDILPTLLGLASLAVPERLRGRDFSALLGAEAMDEEPEPRPVFAQLLRHGSFQRSVRVGDWKLVETYRFRRSKDEPSPTGRLAVTPGERVKLRGAVGEDGRFIARELVVDEQADAEIVLRGVVSALDRGARWLEIAPFRVSWDDDTRLSKRDSWWPLAEDAFDVGDIVEVDGTPAGPRRIAAQRIELRVDPREGLLLKLEAPAEAVSPEPPGGLRVLGVDVVFEADVPLPGIEVPRRLPPIESAALADRARTRLSVALFDLAEDPGEHRDVAVAHPERVAALRGVLAAGPEASAEAARRNLDTETVDRLRALGYVD